MVMFKKDKNDDTARLTAQAHGVSTRYVYMIINGERNPNTPKAKAIISTYNNILRAKHNLSKPVENAA